MAEASKSPLASKLMWLGTVELILGIGQEVVGYLQNLDVNHAQSWGAIGAGVLTIIFRAVTKSKVAFPPKK